MLESCTHTMGNIISRDIREFEPLLEALPLEPLFDDDLSPSSLRLFSGDSSSLEILTGLLRFFDSDTIESQTAQGRLKMGSLLFFFISSHIPSKARVMRSKYG